MIVCAIGDEQVRLCCRFSWGEGVVRADADSWLISLVERRIGDWTEALGVATVEDDVEEDVDKQVWAAGFLPSPTASNNELISERARTIEQSLGVEQLEDDEESKY